MFSYFILDNPNVEYCKIQQPVKQNQIKTIKEMQDIFIALPATNEVTDEDSGDEDTGGFLNNLPHSQLVSEAEAVLSNNVHTGSNTYDFSRYSTRKDRKWTDGDLVDPIKKDTS
ncbi:hypothetical protein ILUMI_24884 [Ignelater luminosus]|uniref:Uncharacterized protein n=1 Tax=Ignelater luminosus TaxID=2038154 RepID=A0A8K0C8B0_IGNLU|nr:hypothetical protein ILUMI_24884 [Ignelater luminosus]